MLQQGNGKNLSRKETIVASQDCPKFLGSSVTCGSQKGLRNIRHHQQQGQQFASIQCFMG